MLAAAGPPPDPHHHLLISTRPPGRSSSIVTQLMETPQISPMTAAWSPLTPSPCSTITYTCNRSPQAPKSVPSSVFLSCVCGVSSVWCWWARVPDLSAVTCVVPQWCWLVPPPLSQVPPVHSTVLCSTVLYCTVLHCSLLVLSIYLHDQGIKVVCLRRMYHPTLVLVFGICPINVRVVVVEELGQHQS